MLDTQKKMQAIMLEKEADSIERAKKRDYYIKRAGWCCCMLFIIYRKFK